MLSAITSAINGLSYLDAINSSNKEKESKNKGIEDIFCDILDQISDTLEEQIDKNNESQKSLSGFNFGPPMGLIIEGFSYYS